MNDKKMNQEQSQNVNVAQTEEQGIIDKIRCKYKTSDPGSSPRNIAIANMSNEVKILIYKGEVRKVFCEYFKNDNCKSPHNKTQEKKCYIKE